MIGVSSRLRYNRRCIVSKGKPILKLTPMPLVEPVSSPKITAQTAPVDTSNVSPPSYISCASQGSLLTPISQSSSVSHTHLSTVNISPDHTPIHKSQDSACAIFTVPLQDSDGVCQVYYIL
mmetsp:Transcript_35852/g.50793  ORF Transcript_35852/g.50793 Transcript_35852/m.50793 type:complete len:121 (+) Transcript_35852:33-395(+)